MSRLVIVGEAPGGKGNHCRPALDPTEGSGKRLAQMMGLTPVEFCAMVDRRNLFNTPDEGKAWNALEAGKRAERMAHSFIDGDRVVLLGARVSKAFDLLGYDLLTWHRQLVEGGTIVVALTPHPSGRNRLLNDPDLMRRMAEFLKGALVGVTG